MLSNMKNFHAKRVEILIRIENISKDFVSQTRLLRRQSDEIWFSNLKLLRLSRNGSYFKSYRCHLRVLEKYPQSRTISTRHPSTKVLNVSPADDSNLTICRGNCGVTQTSAWSENSDYESRTISTDCLMFRVNNALTICVIHWKWHAVDAPWCVTVA